MSVKSVLIIRCGALGDLVYATSVIDALKLQYGQNTIIDFVCTPGVSKLFDTDERVRKVYTLKHKKTPIWLSSDKKRIIKASKEVDYDLLINFESGKQFKSLVNAIHAKQKTGYMLTQINIPQNITHMVDIIKQTFKEVVSEDIFNKSFPKLVGTSANIVKQKYDLNDDYLIVSPSNSHQKKSRLNYRAWENESWKELIKKLSSEIQLVIIGNRGEDDFFDKLRPFPSNVIDLAGKTSLVDLIGVVDCANGLISTDTGTAHIASAVNTEVFALIGPTPANQTGPYQSPTNKVHIISANLPCSPCYKTEVMKNCKDNICMKGISVQQVYNSIKSAKIL